MIDIAIAIEGVMNEWQDLGEVAIIMVITMVTIGSKCRSSGLSGVMKEKTGNNGQRGRERGRVNIWQHPEINFGFISDR